MRMNVAAPPASGWARDSEAKAYASGKLNRIMTAQETRDAGPATVAAPDDTKRMPEPRMAAMYSATACGKVMVPCMKGSLLRMLAATRMQGRRRSSGDASHETHYRPRDEKSSRIVAMQFRPTAQRRQENSRSCSRRRGTASRE